MKYIGGTTTGLLKHLKGIHNIYLDKENNLPITEDVISEIKKKKAKLTDFYPPTLKPSLGVTISRMVSLDGIPFRTFTQPEDLKRLLLKENNILPKSSNSIREIVLKEKETLKPRAYDKYKEDFDRWWHVLHKF